MAHDLKTTYRGYEISYGENSETWVCRDIEGAGNASLAKVKANIDAYILSLRKSNVVDCYIISRPYNGSAPTLTEGTVTEYLKAEKPKSYMRKDAPITHKVAVTARRRGNDRASRATENLDELAPSTPEVRAQFAEVEKLFAARAEADAALSRAVAALPRLTLSDVQALVDIKNSESEQADG